MHPKIIRAETVQQHHDKPTKKIIGLMLWGKFLNAKCVVATYTFDSDDIRSVFSISFARKDQNARVREQTRSISQCPMLLIIRTQNRG
ncbi:hypothetical protein BJF97_02975 [Klebsiella sp. LTGPAF-6F]|nr:hypothetical protein BJF97_02975 [Klebsiella sp. LTGPAF-6F]